MFHDLHSGVHFMCNIEEAFFYLIISNIHTNMFERHQFLLNMKRNNDTTFTPITLKYYIFVFLTQHVTRL